MTLADDLSIISPFHGLHAPMTHAACEVRLTRALPARHLPFSGFDYPLNGLLLRTPRRPCFVPTAPVGFTLRSVCLFGGWSGVTAVRDPHVVAASPRFDQPKLSEATELEARLPGTSSGESLTADHRCLACKAAGCSHGFSPSQGFSLTAWTNPSTRLLSRAWLVAAVTRNGLPTPQSFDRRSLSPTRRPNTPLRVLHL